MGSEHPDDLGIDRAGGPLPFVEPFEKRPHAPSDAANDRFGVKRSRRACRALATLVVW